MQICKSDHSTVCECVHRGSGDRYSVKSLDSQAKEAANESIMFSLAQSHENILSLVAIMEDEVEKKLYLVSELILGGNLLSRVVQEDERFDNNTRSNDSQVQRLAVQLLLGVHHLHETACLAHNDLHPANILLGEDGSLRIADFGSTGAKESSTPNYGNNNNSSSSTIKALSSSNCYCAPEQLGPGGPSSSTEADMWSVGVILYYCLFGPDDTLTHASLIDGIHNFSAKDRSPAWNHQTSRHAKQFLASLIHMDPTVRMTVDEALRHPWLEGLAPLPPQSLPPLPEQQQQLSSQPRSHRRMPRLRRSMSRFASYFKRQQQE